MLTNRFSPRTGFQRVRNLIRRAVGHAGPDRDTLLLIIKSALAATIAWVLADLVLQAPSATFAPFSALLMVQVTVLRSLDQAFRYASAVVAGVVLAGLLSPLLGATVWTFAILMIIALILGRWRRLGSQGPQVAVAALFAYAAFVQTGGSPESFSQLLSIAGLVILGCGIGVITNLAILPPMRYRSAQYAVSGLAQSTCDLLSDLAEGLREGVPGTERADDWRHRSAQLPDSVSQTRQSVEHAAETFRFNPRRKLTRHSASFEGHRTIVNVLERVTDQLRSITRGLRYAADIEEPSESHHSFLRYYADLLYEASESTRILGELHNLSDLRADNGLDDAVHRGRDTFQDLSKAVQEQQLDPVGEWPTFSVLQTDAHRLVEELVEAVRELAELADPESS